MGSTTKDQIMADMAESSREVVEKYPELKGLALGLAQKLFAEDKTKDDVVTDERVIEWTRCQPVELVQDGYAIYALCHMVEMFMTPMFLPASMTLEDERRFLASISDDPFVLGSGRPKELPPQ